MKIGDKVRILEYTNQYTHYARYKIIKIYDKKFYNMYLCKNIKTGCTQTFTDFDTKIRYRGRRLVEKEVV